MNKKDKTAELKAARRRRKASVRKAAKFMTETGLYAGTGALIGMANYFYDFSMKPVKRDTSHDEEKHEQPYMVGRRWMNGHPQRQDWYERAEDGLRIHANFIPSSVEGGDHRFVICQHGYSDSSEGMGVYAMVYHDVYGMNVVMPDLRGHGKSETVLMVTGEKLPSNIKACIEDASFTTAMEEFAHVYSTLKEKPPISSDVLLPIMRTIALVRAGYDLNDAAPIEAVKRSVTPTLFIHGEADTFIPSHMMTKLFESAACEKMCMMVPKAEHVKSVVVDPEGYWDKVESFLRLVDPELVERRV